MSAKFRIFEAPDGRYKLGMAVKDGAKDFWMPCWSELWFTTMPEAEAAIRRLVAARAWYYDAEGKPYVELGDE